MFLVLYVVGAVLSVWPIAQLILNADQPIGGGTQDAMDRFFAGSIAVIAAAMWPMILGGWLAWKVSTAVWSRILPDRENEKQAR